MIKTNKQTNLKSEPLEARRTKAQLTIFYKSVKNLVDIPMENYATPASARTRANHSKKFCHLSSNTNVVTFSFVVRTIPIWNSLPASTAEAPSLAQFRRELTKLKL